MDAVLAVAVFAGAYIFLVADRVHRTKVALVGAGLTLLLHISDAESAFFSETSGIEWNVIFLLLGMMVIVSVLRQTGIFEYVAIWCAKRSRGKPYRLMVMLCVLTATASALLDNVTTVLLIAPVTFLVCDRLGLNPVPYLIAEVMASNIGGAATLVGDPPNIIIASRADLSFNDFLVHMAPWVVVLMVVFCLLCRVLFRSAFVYDAERAESVMALNEREAIKDTGLLIRSLLVLSAVVAAFVLHPVLHYQPSVVALLGAGLLVLVTDVSRRRRPSGGRVVDARLLRRPLHHGRRVGGDGSDRGPVRQARRRGPTVGWGSPPCCCSAAPACCRPSWTTSPTSPRCPPWSRVWSATVPGNSQVLWWSLAFGADLGGNATAIGASANVVMLGLAERAGHRIGFWEFTKYGLVVTAVTVGLTAPYLALRYL